MLRGFKLTSSIAMDDGKPTEFAIIARLCTRGCAQKMQAYRAANCTTEPPEIKTMWGGSKLEPLRTGGEQ